MEEMIAILGDFKLSEINLIKYTLHECAIMKLIEWKVRHIKRQNSDIDDDRPDTQGWKKGKNTQRDLELVNQLFASADGR